MGAMVEGPTLKTRRRWSKRLIGPTSAHNGSLAHDRAREAAGTALAEESLGMAMAAMIPMIATTIKSSTKVDPRRWPQLAAGISS